MSKSFSECLAMAQNTQNVFNILNDLVLWIVFTNLTPFYSLCSWTTTL